VKVVYMRCSSCHSTHAFMNQDLDMCRLKVCERCNIKLTVVRSEGQIDPVPMPDRERVKQTEDVTKKEAETAKRLLVAAFEKA
jgi:hypothetical protein